MSTAGHTPDVSPTRPPQSANHPARRVSLARRLRPRIAAELVTAALNALELPAPADTDPGAHSDPETTAPSPDSATDTTGASDEADTLTAELLDWANETAGDLYNKVNAGRMASRARFKRGEIAALRTGWPIESERFVDACDELDAFAPSYAADLTDQRRALQPVIDLLLAPQRSPTSYELQPDDTAMTGVWASRAHWIPLAIQTVERVRATGATAQRTGIVLDLSPDNVAALVTGLADFFDQSGHGCTASRATITARAIERHGATCAASTGQRRLRTITGILADENLLLLQAAGRRLSSIERLAAHHHHGGDQRAAANRWDANVPAWLMPAAQPAPQAPGYATGQTRRIAARDTADATRFTRRIAAVIAHCAPWPSPYTVGYGFPLSYCRNRVTHKRAQARAGTDNPPGQTHPSRQTAGPSSRARRIADDLTRNDDPRPQVRGPYAHLCGTQRHQMPLNRLARLIDMLTPDWAGTRDVLAGLVHAATSPETGFTALGLRGQPRNATAWITRVLDNIDWSDAESFPAWWKTAAAFDLRWQGSLQQYGRGARWANVG